MKRDHFELEVSNVAWMERDDPPEQPRVRIDFHGVSDMLTDRVRTTDGELLSAAETDVAFRLQEPLEETGDARGVVSVTNRFTGDFILELNATADDVLRFIGAAREYDRQSDTDDGSYRIDISIDGTQLLSHEKSVFLVYGDDGQLLRSESLIPSGVEL